MLQQTQVATVIPYYKKFLKSFPTLHHLAKSNLSKVLKVWEGLGYYSRARNLHRSSQIVLNRFHGKIPETLKDLLSLPGIGRSTAGAILSFAFHKEAPFSMEMQKGSSPGSLLFQEVREKEKRKDFSGKFQNL